MIALRIIGSIVTAVTGLLLMCLCGLIFNLFNPAVSSVVCFLVFVASVGIILEIWLLGSKRRGQKVAALCIFIGLLGIAVMQFCNLLIIPPFSGFAGFTVFMAVVAVIVLIIVNQKKFFNLGNEDPLQETLES